MVVISVLYPKNSDSHFDYGYYLEKHMPLVRSRWTSMGLVTDTLLRGTSTLEGGQPAFELLGYLAFETMEQIQAALTAHGHEILGDISNFTNVSPMVQVNQPV